MREAQRPRSSDFPPGLCHLAVRAGASQPQGTLGGNTNAEARAKRRPSVQRGKTEQAQNKLGLAPMLNITVSES